MSDIEFFNELSQKPQILERIFCDRLFNPEKLPSKMTAEGPDSIGGLVAFQQTPGTPWRLFGSTLGPFQAT